MKFSESWLREWVNPNVTTEELCEQLSMAGLEVDSTEACAAEFSGVVVGEVVECGPHPDADKLQVTKVHIGEDALLDIVCGAPNCRPGLKVAVAKVGAVLPGNFKIKKAKLRGQPSFGMLCSFSELGMGEDHSGIIELPEEAEIGQNIRDYLNLDDTIIEIDLTPNRADCLGIKGIAREVGVLNQKDIKSFPIKPSEIMTETTRLIQLDDPIACPRYAGRVIENIDMSKGSPLWLKEKLRRSSIRSIDPVVDVTNLVLIELGHPMHAFDNDKLDGQIVVRKAKDRETITLLDSNEVALNSNTLVIADESKALAMAGVFGGLESGVTTGTSNIFLESAFFEPDSMMGVARQYGLHTDASHRYERGVDPSLQIKALDRATQLLVEIVGGQPGPITEAISKENLPKREQIELRNTRMARLLGVSVDAHKVTDILNRLGMQVAVTDKGWLVTPPAYRFDIEIEEDLIEEIARVFGYNNIPNQSPLARLSMTTKYENKIETNKYKALLCAKGCFEAVTYSFVDPKEQSLLFPEAKTLTLPHPISSDMSVMRVSLLPGLIKALSYNQKRQQAQLALYETGLVYSANENSENGVSQKPMIGGILSGQAFPEHWAVDTKALDFFDLKALVEDILSLSTGNIEFVSTQHTAYHPGICADVKLNGEYVGTLGAVHPKFEKKLGLTGRTFAFELLLDNINTRSIPDVMPISKFPAIRRDLAVIVSNQIETGKLLKSIEKIGISDLISINLFDLYKGKGIEVDKKSLALSIWLQSADKTLEDQEIQASVDKVIDHLRDNFGAALRD